MIERVQHIIDQSATRWPGRAAVIDQDGYYSYRQLQAEADNIASVLFDLDVAPGSVVGISVADARGFMASLFGLLKAKCVAIPVAPHAPQAEQIRIISEAGVAWLISGGSSRQRTEKTSGEVCGVSIKSLVWEGYRLSIASCRATLKTAVLNRFQDAAVIRYTSGTTGRAKGVVLSHKAVHERTDASIRLLGLTDSDVVLTPLSISYHFIASALSCLKAGATILDCSAVSADQMLNLGIAHEATVLYAAPIHYEEMSNVKLLRSFPSLRSAVSTSALLPKSVAESFFERFSIRLTQVYGIIEVGLPLWNELESMEPSALGICKHPYEACVVDEHGVAVPVGNVGELAIRGPGLFSGYLLGAASAADLFMLGGEWFLTGDLVVQDELGIILYRGRKKSVINSGGNKIFPEEVEEVLLRCPEIRAVRVSAKPDPRLGSLIVAEVVVDPEKGPAVDEWSAICKTELSSYKVPNEFIVVESHTL